MEQPKANPIVLTKTDELFRVLRAAQLAGYAGGDVNRHGNGTASFVYEDGPWEVIDYWVAGQPSKDMTEVFYEGVICWSMVGWDGVKKGSLTDEMYEERKGIVLPFLKEALCAPNDRFPVRGPACFGEGPLRYYCCSTLHRNFDEGVFHLEEMIINPEGNGEPLFSGVWHGGWSNIR